MLGPPSGLETERTMNLDAYIERLKSLPAVDPELEQRGNEEGYDEGTEPWEDTDLLDWEYDPSVKDQRA
jgi:hypothetical protein